MITIVRYQPIQKKQQQKTKQKQNNNNNKKKKKHQKKKKKKTENVQNNFHVQQNRPWLAGGTNLRHLIGIFRNYSEQAKWWQNLL